MPLMTRRAVVTGAGLTAFGLGGYAFAIEPGFRLEITSYRVTPANWPRDFDLRIAVIADLHAGEPQMPAQRIAHIVEATNALKPDLIVLLGDYVAAHKFVTRIVPSGEWAGLLGTLKAPLGVHAVLGNHDWWDDPGSQARRGGPTLSRLALEAAGIGVLENDAVRLSKAGKPFWLLGLADQLALLPLPGAPRSRGRSRATGLHDLAGTLARINDDAPAILLAHEPDIFPRVPNRVALTISGHTHGGQVRVAGYSPIVPSNFGNRYAYGHMIEQGRHLIVSGGLGTSTLPVRFGVPPEIVVVDVAGGGAAIV